MEDNDHVADAGHPCSREAERERCCYLKAGYLIFPLQDREAALEIGVGAVDVKLSWSSIDLADSVLTRQPLVLPYVSAAKCVLHTLVSYLGDDVLRDLCDHG